MRTIDIIMAKRFGKGKKGMVIGWPLMLGVSGGTEDTVTGNAPLSLPSALAKAIKSLTQTGLCTQASTPTPSVPVDIYCNNGAFKTVRASGLPVRYQRVEYLISTKSISLGIKTKSTFELEASVYRPSGAQAQYIYVSDSNSSGTTNTTAYTSTGEGGANWRWDGKTQSVNVPTGDVTTKQNSSGVWLNGSKVASYSSPSTFESSSNLCIHGTQSNADMRIKWLTAKDGDTLVRDMIPVHDLVDDVGGWYDRVNGVFYTNSDATITMGADVSDPISLAVVGTPEVITLGEQTASAVDLLGVGDYADTQEIISGAVTRKVGIKVFDGTETWTIATNNDAAGNKCFYTPFNDRAGGVSTLTMLCTHYAQAPAASYTTLTANTFLYNPNSSNKNVYFDGGTITSKTDWQAWLAAQYAAGTPVIVIYPLAEQTTESVAGQPLSTTAGDNTITVTANVSPIELEAVYMKGA